MKEELIPPILWMKTQSLQGRISRGQASMKSQSGFQPPSLNPSLRLFAPSKAASKLLDFNSKAPSNHPSCHLYMVATAKSLQSCLTLCDPIDSNPPGSPVPGILQARTLEWVAISFSNAWKWKLKVKSLSRVQLLVTPWTAAHQGPPSMRFSRQGYWSGVPLPSPPKSIISH